MNEAAMMPDVVTRLGRFFSHWFTTWVKPVLLKAPRDAPDLFVVVLGLAIVVVALYVGVLTSHV